VNTGAKHIVIVGPAHPLRGGLATYNERLAREFSKNHRVTLLTFSLQYPSFLFPGETQYTSDPQPEDLHIDIALNSINPISWIRTGLRYRKARPDVVIFRYWMPFFGPCFGVVGRIIKSNRHTQIKAITDNIIPHEPKWFDRLFTTFFLGMLDAGVSMSKQVLQQLQEQFPFQKVSQNSQFQAHPLYDNFGEKIPRSEACIQLGLREDRRYILFFGFIRRYKGLDWLLEAFFQMAHEWNDVDLIVAGEFYEDATPYLDLIAQSGMANRVHMHTHFIPNEQVSAYFSVSDVVAQTYKSATQSGVSQIAYHFDIPMIVTDVGGLAELVPHDVAGWVCEARISSITEGLSAVLDPSRLWRYRSEMPRLKQRFSWEEMAKALLR
jgi:D-inositol-3-phosphate glycosyltransferase